jgi:hypothetical protein
MSYSQIGQDVFVDALFENRKGFFLDFGCGGWRDKPNGNNTLYLEERDWDGLSVDMNPTLIKEFTEKRKTKAVCQDLTKIDIKEFLETNQCPKLVDYFSFDVDAATDHVLNHFPFDEFKFKFITFEHNLYDPNYKGLKERALKIFENKGYKLLVENVEWRNLAVEDWFIHSDYSDLPKLGKNILHTDCVKLLEPYINKIT